MAESRDERKGALLGLKSARCEVETLNRRIFELSGRGAVRRITGMPGGSDPVDRTGETAVELSALRKELVRRRVRCIRQIRRAEEIISACPDAVTRQALSLYYVEGLSWLQVARQMRCAQSTPRKRCERYLRGKCKAAK